jgi:hypothetical protein
LAADPTPHATERLGDARDLPPQADEPDGVDSLPKVGVAARAGRLIEFFGRQVWGKREGSGHPW